MCCLISPCFVNKFKNPFPVFGEDEQTEPVNLYQYGPKDAATVVFYLLIAVILHALMQEYILDVCILMSHPQLLCVCKWIASI